MGEDATVFDLVLRGAAAGMSLLLAVALITNGKRSRTGLFGGLFALSSAAYVVISSPAINAQQSILAAPVVAFAIWGTVFFWWFATSLFDDAFRWRWWRFAPLVVLSLNYLIRKFGFADGMGASILLYLHPLINGILFADVLRVVLQHASDDLVNPRRRFRLVFGAVVGAFGIGIALVEMAENQVLLPAALLHFQAVAVLAMTLIFGLWLLVPKYELITIGDQISPDERRLDNSAPPGMGAADRVAYERLNKIMQSGAYRTEGLTVAALAEKVGVPEHQLRKLINGALGFRNFSSFLNSYRIEDAKAALADPENARRQIIQIALDLGYGSIAPFNRAFKQATGKTPTEFRKQTLGSG